MGSPPVLEPVNSMRLTTGPDGALWFTEYLANKIGRSTPCRRT